MDCSTLISCIRAETKSSPYKLDFIPPVVSVGLAAYSRLRGKPSQISIEGEAVSYAKNNGLMDVLDGKPVEATFGGLQGVTYTRIAQLQSDHEVEDCNGRIGSFFKRQLKDLPPVFVSDLCRVVGELHDNVPSHARGVGFSAAQVYQKNGRQHVKFAIADSGRGFLHNVRRKQPELKTHAGAISWCLQRRNTTAEEPDDWAQSAGPGGDAPYGKAVSTKSSDNHHLGLGLWHLTELARKSKGFVSVWTGDAVYSCLGDGTSRIAGTDQFWQGVVIDMDIIVASGMGYEEDSGEDLEALGRRLGI